jgi:hypothetical protein
MKFILQFLTGLALLATAGCIFPGNRDHAEDRNRPGYAHDDEHPAGVDHGEHPGDVDHQESR